MKLLFNIISLLLAGISSYAYNPPSRSELLWDEYGVPHIYSNSIAGMYYSFGWAQMHNHANLVLRLYGAAKRPGRRILGRKIPAAG